MNEKITRVTNYFKRNGLKDTVFKVGEKLSSNKAEAFYSTEFEMMRVREEELIKQREATFTHTYKISILVPAYETDPIFLADLLDSVTGQSYSNWELIVADGSKSGIVRHFIEDYSDSLEDPEMAARIKYLPLSENGGISANTNAALEAATGEYIGLLDHDDILEKDALYEVMRVLEANLYMESNMYTNRIKVIYTDEDKTNSDNTEYFCPHYKPDFNIDLLRSNNYICHFLVVRTELARAVGGFNSEYDGAQDYDFILRLVENIPVSAVYHIDKVLYHWRTHSKSTADNPESKLYAYESGKKAVEDHLKRKGIKAEVIDTNHLGFYRVRYRLEAASVRHLTRTEWDSLTKEELKDISEDFIMVLASDLKPLTADYIDELVGVLCRYEVGCVGGKVYDKRNRVESAGFMINAEGDFVPEFEGLYGHYSGYMHRASLMRKVDGVSLDCMMVRKSAVDFKNDKPTLATGYVTVFDPYAEFRRK